MTSKRAGAHREASDTPEPAQGIVLNGQLRADGIVPDAPVAVPASRYTIHRAFAAVRADNGKHDYFTSGNEAEVETAVSADLIARYIDMGYITDNQAGA
jgi:hypothetical protein